LSAVLSKRGLLIPVALVVLAGCGSVPNSDVVARVGDAELDRDEFSTLVDARRAATGVPVDSLPEAEAARVDGETARGITGQFVVMELVRSDMIELGLEVPDVDSGLEGAERFDAEYQAIGTAWSATPPETMADDRLREWYEQGPTESGVACVQHILVEERAQADDVLARLEAGEPFADVAADSSTDPGSAAQGGSLGCAPLSTFRQQFIPEFVDGSLAAEVGVPTQPIETEFGHHVIRVTPFDELAGDDILVSRLIALADWHDIETDPEIGVWEFPNVVPLG
jgi:hypothetical protein